MRVQRTSGFLLAVLALIAFAAPAAAQQGTLTGRVTDVETGQPVDAAQVQVVGMAQVTGGLTDSSGRYTLTLPAGGYSLVVERVGYRPQRFDGVRVRAGQTTAYDIVLTSMAYELNPVVVTASKTEESESDAPSTTHTVSSLQIQERVVTTPADYLADAPGVDKISYGIQGANVVVRGFNNIFSGALHMLSDHRLAGIPSLRVNLMHFIPSNEQDLERIEVVLGPGSALYGPNTANGIVHMITKSPLDDQGTSVTVGMGSRSVFQGSFRSAFLLSEDFGFKISGQYLQGDEWEFTDPTEQTNRQAADDNPQQCLADKALRGVTGAAAQAACDRIGIRDYSIERYGFEARADWRIAENGTLVATYGRNNSSGIELTGLGAGQTVDWVYEFYQARLNIDRFFAQAYLNTSDAGQSYLLNSGVPLVDLSKLFVAQARHGFALADGRQDFTYGVDYIGTRPQTEGNINGTYEDDDNMNEWGAYLQSKTALSDQVDLIAAGRIDNHSILAENVFSPRVALVMRPTENQTFRLSFNQAYSSPSSLNYFLDISNGFAPLVGSLGFGLRAFGTGRDGWSLLDSSGQLKGFRSPFNPAGASQLVPMAGAANFWQATIGVLQAQVAAGALPPELGALLPLLAGLSPTAADIGASLYRVGEDQVPVPLAQATLPTAVPSIGKANTESYELGWTGIIDGRFKLTADAYYMKKNNFVSPLLIQTPLVMLNGQDVGSYLGSTIGATLVQLYVQSGLSLEQAQAQAQSTITTLATGIGGIPIGVVSANEISGGSDIVVTYRNVGDLTLWGSDLALQWFLDDAWTLTGTYSYVSDDTFPIDDGEPIALNAPRHKGSFGLAYRNPDRGFNAEARFRFNSEFPAVSAGFEGDVPSTEVVDMSLGYRIPNTSATVQLSVTDVFDSGYQSFVGVPEMGRFAMFRVKYDLF